MEHHKSKAAAGGDYTNTPPTVAGNLPRGWLPASSISEAEYLSLPRPRERCRFSNLSRTALVELLNRGTIAGVSLRRPGALRGKRLIFKKSLADYLQRLLSEQMAQRTTVRKQEGDV